ncbi:unnamed protein product [Symbiodinium sp. CCMP2592]|nr:unnamed protein product [Symbiodinium sp. CCMP2592]
MSKSPEGGLRSLSGTELTMPFKIEHIPDSLKEETQEHFSRSMEFFNKVNKEFQKLQEQLQQVTQERDALRQQNNCLQQQLERASSEQTAAKPVVLSQPTVLPAPTGASAKPSMALERGERFVMDRQSSNLHKAPVHSVAMSTQQFKLGVEKGHQVNGIDFHEGQQENASRTSRVACRRFLAIALQSAVVCGLSNRLTRREATQQVVLQQPCRRRITVRRRQNRRRHRRRQSSRSQWRPRSRRRTERSRRSRPRRSPSASVKRKEIQESKKRRRTTTVPSKRKMWRILLPHAAPRKRRVAPLPTLSQRLVHPS